MRGSREFVCLFIRVLGRVDDKGHFAPRGSRENRSEKADRKGWKKPAFVPASALKFISASRCLKPVQARQWLKFANPVIGYRDNRFEVVTERPATNNG